MIVEIGSETVRSWRGTYFGKKDKIVGLLLDSLENEFRTVLGCFSSFCNLEDGPFADCEFQVYANSRGGKTYMVPGQYLSYLLSL